MKMTTMMGRLISINIQKTMTMTTIMCMTNPLHLPRTTIMMDLVLMDMNNIMEEDIMMCTNMITNQMYNIMITI